MRLGAAQTASKRLAFSRIQNGMLKFEKYDIDKSTITPLQSNTIHIYSWDPLLYFSKWHQISHLKLNHWLAMRRQCNWGRHRLPAKTGLQPGPKRDVEI
jgi:hypothetical protein